MASRKALKETPSMHAIVEEAGMAFDPASQHLDLTKDEKRRTTALLLAIQAYQHLIIKEADYLEEAAKLARKGEGPKIQPATIDAMVDAAIRFDIFISGEGAVRDPEPAKAELERANA